MKNFLDNVQHSSVKLLLAGLAVLAPVQSVILTVGVLIGIDFVTGILAARKRGEQITSAKMRQTVSKLVVYNIAVISGFLVEKYLLQGILPASRLVAGVIGMVELQSILENSNTLSGTSIFDNLIKRLGSSNALSDHSQPQDQNKNHSDVPPDKP